MTKEQREKQSTEFLRLRAKGVPAKEAGEKARAAASERPTPRRERPEKPKRKSLLFG